MASGRGIFEAETVISDGAPVKLKLPLGMDYRIITGWSADPS